MALYEMQCVDCGHQFEVICKYEDRTSQRCPQCQGKSEGKISKPGYYEIKGNNSASRPSNYAKKFRGDK